jgi:ABC-type multidrug transport system permease subunit
MAYKSIFSKKFLPFHEEAAGLSWDSIDKRLQNVIITILRISGLGFFIIFLFLSVFSIINYFKPDPLIKFSIPVISLIYCFGLFLFNFLLFKQTKARTPWIGSIIAMIMILSGFVISIL